MKKRGTDGKKKMTFEQRSGRGGKLSIQITEGKGSQSGGPQAASSLEERKGASPSVTGGVEVSSVFSKAILRVHECAHACLCVCMGVCVCAWRTI